MAEDPWRPHVHLICITGLLPPYLDPNPRRAHCPTDLIETRNPGIRILSLRNVQHTVSFTLFNKYINIEIKFVVGLGLTQRRNLNLGSLTLISAFVRNNSTRTKIFCTRLFRWMIRLTTLLLFIPSMSHPTLVESRLGCSNEGNLTTKTKTNLKERNTYIIVKMVRGQGHGVGEEGL